MLKKRNFEKEFNRYIIANERNNNWKFHQVQAAKLRQEIQLVVKNEK